MVCLNPLRFLYLFERPWLWLNRKHSQVLLSLSALLPPLRRRQHK